METEKLALAAENLVLSGMKCSTPHTQQLAMATKLPYKEEDASIVTTTSSLLPPPPSSSSSSSSSSAAQPTPTQTLVKSPVLPIANNIPRENVGAIQEDDSKSKSMKNVTISKNKRKRRRGGRGGPKTNIKPYKKSNWRFQMPRFRNNGNSMGGGGNKLTSSSRCIVPYNTNRFLMDEHLAEVPSALLTPSGRTRDSSFSVDSEDNYFYSLPEDEEEFLTKDFDNAYEKTRVERLENMSKQQLIEEYLQLEDRSGVHQAKTFEFLNKIRILEEKLRDLSNENQDLRRKLDNLQKNTSQQAMDGVRVSNTSEDSESDSSSSSSSSTCGSNSFSSRCSSMVDLNESPMESDDIVDPVEISGNNGNNREDAPPITANCNGHVECFSSESKESSLSPTNSLIESSSAQRIIANPVVE